MVFRGSWKALEAESGLAKTWRVDTLCTEIAEITYIIKHLHCWGHYCITTSTYRGISTSNLNKNRPSSSTRKQI